MGGIFCPVTRNILFYLCSRYEFQTEDFDVGFGVFRKTSKERMKAADMVTVLATHRSNSHLIPEDGALECDTAAICESY